MRDPDKVVVLYEYSKCNSHEIEFQEYLRYPADFEAEYRNLRRSTNAGAIDLNEFFV